MQRVLFALLSAAFMLAACAGETTPQEEPLDAEKVRLHREHLAACEENNWNGCAGGFVRVQGEGTVFQIINTDPDVTLGANVTPHADEMTSTQIIENAPTSPEGDRWLNSVEFIWPNDSTVWEGAAVEFARQRTQ